MSSKLRKLYNVVNDTKGKEREAVAARVQRHMDAIEAKKAAFLTNRADNTPPLITCGPSVVNTGPLLLVDQWKTRLGL